jgi:hypothetical protein
MDAGMILAVPPAMPFNRWKSLSPTTQAFWDTIPDAEHIPDVSPETPTDEVPVEDIPLDLAELEDESRGRTRRPSS